MLGPWRGREIPPGQGLVCAHSFLWTMVRSLEAGVDNMAPERPSGSQLGEVVLTATFTLRLIFVGSLPFSQASQICDHLSHSMLNPKQ